MPLPINNGLTRKFLLTLYTLEEPAGILRHKHRPVWMFIDNKHSAEHNCNQWSARWAGKKVNPNPTKYSRTSIQIPGKRRIMVFVHHIIECMRTGRWPTEMIDHKNGNPLDNSRGNHRPVNDSQSAMNHAILKNNTSGVTGVSMYKGEWYAYVNVKNTRIKLYRGHSFERAVAARKRAERRYFGEYARK